MELPQPPQDQELKNIIDKLAQFVARNGPEFEQMTKTKQKDNPKFSFLFGGDYFNYYQYKVTTEQAILKHRQAREQNPNQPQPPQLIPSSMGGYSGSGGPRYDSPLYPYQQYPPSSGFGGGEGSQYPPGVVMGSYHQPQPHPYQMPLPPGSEPSHPLTSGPPASNVASSQNYRPPFPPGDPSYTPQFNAPPNNSEDMYNQQHNVYPAPPPPPVSMSESFNSQPALMGHTGGDHSSTNGYQHLGPSLPPPPPSSGDPGPVPGPPGPPGIPASLQNSVAMQPPQEAETTLENIGFQQLQLQEQIKQSEQNLEGQRKLIEQQNNVQVREAVYVARGELLKKEANELGLNIEEFEDVLTPITESCTKDSISNGKHWIFTHAVSEQKNSWISRYLLYKSTCTTGPFTHKLHIIYLMNDVLHHCVRKSANGLKDSLERVLAPMYCHAVSTANDEQKAKLDKLLNLWESKMNLEEDLLNQLHSPEDSWAAFEKNTVEEFPEVVAAVTQHLNTTFENYQQQHNAFVQHATSQLQQLEQQKQHLEQQQRQQALQQGSAGTPGPPGPPAGYMHMAPHSQHQFMQQGQGGPGGPPQAMGQGLDFNQPPPGFSSGSVPPLIDFSRPPPGFTTEEPKENLIPTVPYFELPAALMAPLINIEDNKYKPIDPGLLRLPPPTPPNERLLRAVENFYQPPSHDRPRNCEGWEQLALYDYYKAKSSAIKEKERLTAENLREKSQSPPPIVLEPPPQIEEPQPQGPIRKYKSVSPEPEEEQIPEPPRRRNSPSPPENRDKENRKTPYRRSRSPPSSRYRSPQQNYSRSPRKSRSRSRSRGSVSRSHSRSRSRSRSRSPTRSRSRSRTRSRTRSRSPTRSRSRSRSPERVPFRKSRSRSITPPSFGMPSFSRPGIIDETNKGHQMLRSMGWSGSGLGAKEQGISTPISAGEIRETPQERFRGLGVPSAQSDPYEAFRKNKGQAFINRMKARAEEKH